MLLPFVTPEIVMGAAFFIVFTQLYTAIDLGRPAQLVGHITFTVSYVVVIVRGPTAGDRAVDGRGGAATSAPRRARRCAS